MLLQSQAKLVDGTLSGSKQKIHGIARSVSMPPPGFRVDGRLPIFIRLYSISGVARIMEIPNTRKMKHVHQCTNILRVKMKDPQTISNLKHYTTSKFVGGLMRESTKGETFNARIRAKREGIYIQFGNHMNNSRHGHLIFTYFK